jgi:subtilisin-like proprotein convertase family protein
MSQRGLAEVSSVWATEGSWRLTVFDLENYSLGTLRLNVCVPEVDLTDGSQQSSESNSGEAVKAVSPQRELG